MADIITTLHPSTDENSNLYPNIKKENVPSKSIDTTKLDDAIISLLNSINELHPSGTDTSANILAFSSDKGIYIGTDTGYWYYWNGSQYVSGGLFVTNPLIIRNNTIEPKKFKNFFKEHYNLLDLNECNNGWIYDDDSIQASSTYKYTDYIPVEPNDVIKGIGWFTDGTSFGISFFTWLTYDENYNVVSHYTTTDVNSVTIPVGAKYIRLSLNNTFLSPNYKPLLYKDDGLTPTPTYFSNTIKDEFLNDVLNGNSFKKASIKDEYLSILASKNLLDSSKCQNGWLDSNNVLQPSTSYKYTDYIPVDEGDVIRCGYQFNGGSPEASDLAIFTWLTYDENYNRVSWYANTNDTSVTIPSGARYVRLSLNSVYFGANVLVYKNTIDMPDYTPYKLTIKDDYLPKTENLAFLIVDANNPLCYQTINSAIADASNNDVIYIKAGTYNEVISTTKNLTLVGADRDKCIIIDTSGQYANSPLYVVGNISVSNLTIKVVASPTAQNAYALHLDKTGSGLMRFTNCTFYNNIGAAIGGGGQQDQYTYFENCEFISDVAETNGVADNGYDGYGAMFFHAPTSSGITNSGATFKNCVFRSTLNRVITLSSIQDLSNMELTFINCLLYSKYNKKTNVVHYNAVTYLTISEMSYGNSTNELN